MSVGPTGPIGSLMSNPGLLQALYPNIDLTAFSQMEQEQMAALEAPIQALTNQISNLNKVSSAWSSIQAAVNALQSDAQSLSESSTWTSPQATSSNTSVAAATASSSATAGSYTVNVTAAGLEDQWLSQSETSDTSALSLAGTFTINGTSINVTSGDSLQAIAQKVNAANAGATAEVLTSTTNGTTSYYLEVSSTEDTKLTITDPNGIFSGTGSSGLGMTETQTGQPWSYSVNGVTTSSLTGEDTTTVPGLTINLSGTGTTTISVTDSTKGAESALSQFTSDYNALNSLIGNDTGKGAILEGDPTAEGIMGQVNQILLATNTSLPSGYQSPTDVGLGLQLQSDKTTKLTFSSSTFDAAMQADPSAVQSIFTGTSGVMGQLSTLLQNMGENGTGIIAGVTSGITDQVNALTAQETSEQSIISLQQSAMKTQFNQEMQALIAVSSQSNSIESLFNQYFSTGSGNGSSTSKQGG